MKVFKKLVIEDVEVLGKGKFSYKNGVIEIVSNDRDIQNFFKGKIRGKNPFVKWISFVEVDGNEHMTRGPIGVRNIRNGRIILEK